MKHWLQKLKCRFGHHQYESAPTIASLDTYWMQGGDRCIFCGHHHIEYERASTLIKFAYARGKEKRGTEVLAYCDGLDEMVKLYGVKYIVSKLAKDNTIAVVEDALEQHKQEEKNK